MWLKLTLIYLMLVSIVHPCIENCQTCSRPPCDSCKDGFYLGSTNDCSYPCPSNCKTCKSYDECTECKDGFYKGYGPGGSYDKKCSWTCQSNCIRCNSSEHCSICKDGFYIGYDASVRAHYTDCSIPCPANCKRCKSHEQCSVCVDGFYIGYEPNKGRNINDCTLRCPHRCASCLSLDNCTSCKGNFTGNKCNECADGKFGSDCTRDCPPQCRQCSSLDNCTSCVDGFYNTDVSETTPLVCNNSCHENCLSCNSSTHCHTCKAGFYIGFDAFNTYLDDCSLTCPSSCRTCISSNNCTACQPGYLGSLCKACPVGYYGDDCKGTCKPTCVSCTSRDLCTACKQGYNGTRCEVCVDGKYGVECDEDCPESCQTCTSRDQCQVCKADYNGTSCLDCINGKYGNDCESMCPSNCGNGVCGRQTGVCQRCFPPFYGPYCNQSCPETCSTCSSFENCILCKTGKYGITCSFDCPANCKDECDKIYGYCNRCLDGYHGIMCEYECLANCATCESSEKCTSCKVEFTGQTCQNMCGHCKSGSGCRITDGVCFEGCEDGYRGTTCLYNCSSVCVTCSLSSANDCDTCVNGKYGKHPFLDHYTCNLSCPVNCLNKSCDRDTGKCSACVDGYGGKKCDCPELCDTCSSPDVCSSCHDGYANTDKNCECRKDICTTEKCETCSNSTWFADNATSVCCKCSRKCFNSECSSERKCLRGCVMGHYGEGCEQLCSPHDQNCVECKSNGSVYTGCTKCKDGFYPNETGACIVCHGTCVNQSCSSTNGHCILGCLNLTWGEQCDNDCPKYCSMCDRKTGHCLKCQDGNYFIDCSDNCSNNCNTNERRLLLCTANSSRCVHICSDGCIEKKCDNNSGRCVYGCTEGFFGSTCISACSDNCADVRSGRRCSESSGTCSNGCKAGYYGAGCDDRCSIHCVNGVCYGPKGHCTFGCVDGYKGGVCSRDTEKAANASDTSGDVIGVTAGISGAATAVVFVFVIVCLLRKRSQKRKTDKEAGNTQGQAVEVELAEVAREDTAEPIYSNLSDSVVMDDVLGNPTDEVPATDPVRCQPERNQAHNQRASLQPAGASNLLPNPNRHSTKHAEGIDDTPLYANCSMVTDDTMIAANSPMVTDDTMLPMEEDVDEDTNLPMEERDTDKDVYYNTFSPLISVEKLQYYVANKPLHEYCMEFQQLPRGLVRPYADAVKPKNMSKNRYRDIFPYDETRVHLSGPGTDYINASYIDGFEKERAYIAALGPTVPTTANFVDFWAMVWQQRVERIVMLTNLVENRVMKCEKYWPVHGTNTRYGDVTVTCHSEDIYAEYTVRTFTVAKGTDQRSLHHIHFTAWPDKGVPDDVTGLIEFRQKVESCETKENGPMVVHCSYMPMYPIRLMDGAAALPALLVEEAPAEYITGAGIGRTGTYIALDILTRQGIKEHAVNIYGCMTTMREQRAGMVQTYEQYRYLHEAIVHALTFDCAAIQGERFHERLAAMEEGHLEKQFELLQRTCAHLSAEETASVDTNKSRDTLNRHGADIPGNLYRPRLTLGRVGGRSDYINAAYVNSFTKPNHYITTQTPLPRTVTDFLTLVDQFNCVCVVSMDPYQTMGAYLLDEIQTLERGLYKVTSRLTETSAGYVVRKLDIFRQGDIHTDPVEKTLTHFQLTQWPDTDPTPRDASKFVEFIKKVESSAMETDPDGKILVHCLTGAERSGLFCVVSVLIQKMEIEHQVSVVNTVRQVKARRKRAIPNTEQFMFCHDCVDAYLKTFETYSNFTG